MAPYDVDVLVTELLKLKKSDIIDALINFRLPSTVNSGDLKRYVKDLSDLKSAKCPNCKEDLHNLTLLPVEQGGQDVSRNSSLEVIYLNKLITEKDAVISNQSIAIDSLKRHNNLLEKLANNYDASICAPTSPSSSKIDKSKNIDSSSIIHELAKIPGSASPQKTISAVSQNQSKFSKTQIAASIHEAETVKKFNEFIQLGLVDNSDAEHQIGDWQITSGLRYKTRSEKSNYIVGTGENNIAGAPAAACTEDLHFFHVFNMHPTVNTEAMMAFLKPRFPEVTCKQLDSRRPEEYSSFKIGISQKNTESFMNPKYWAAGTKINKFFHLRKRPMARK
ncbi:uncharacterized protein LOC132702633 [Cylas formicarius]|uniref:uncharacterized protein LOC132702633 n=1 Tax=Cylas formicarius TaxID=197179 RepID=UPI00295890D5|nr:uncharacterized protein LOC132702633 [Cylas formicarius]